MRDSGGGGRQSESCEALYVHMYMWATDNYNHIRVSIFFTTCLSSLSLSLPFLGILGFFFGLVAVFVTDYNKVMKDGFFQGYNIIVWTVIGLQVWCDHYTALNDNNNIIIAPHFQAIGGLIVATVMKYADNILKGFATAVSIVISSVLSYFFLGDFEPTM